MPVSPPAVRLPPVLERLPLHRAKVEAACSFGVELPVVAGMAVSGSIATGDADVYSDVDLKIAVGDDGLDRAMSYRDAFVDACGNAVARFTAEHVGLDDMVIALYDDLVHVDFYVLALSELAAKNEGLPAFVLWERDGSLTHALSATGATAPPPPDLAWIEARMWTWVWYTHSRILRGELYEALDALQYLRGNVLFPMLAERAGIRAAGSRRAEAKVGELRAPFARTVPTLDREGALSALRATVDLYLELGGPLQQKAGVEPAAEARRVVLAALGRGLEWAP